MKLLLMLVGCSSLLENEMTINTSALKQALAREVNKLARQEDAILATQAMIAVLEAQIAVAKKAK